MLYLRKSEWLIYTFFMCSTFILATGLNASDEIQNNVNQIHTKTEHYIYKSTPQGKLDMRIYLPPDWKIHDTRPAIVFFFGGGWVSGNIDQFRPQALYFASRGMVAACAEYRIKNKHGTLAGKCIEDGKSAVRWLRIHSDNLGIDKKRIVAAGGSAGGHVAACTYISKGYETDGEDLRISSKPNLLVLFNPVLNASASPRRIDRMGDPKTARDLSPNLHLSRDVPPALLFYGSEDILLEEGREYVQKADRLGLEAVLFIANSVSHGFFNKEPWLSRTMYLTDQFLWRHGFIEGEPTVKIPEETNRDMKR